MDRAKHLRERKVNSTISIDAFSEAVYPSRLSKPKLDTDFILNEIAKRQPHEIKEKTYISVPDQCKLSYSCKPQPLQTMSPYHKPRNQEEPSNFTFICMGETNTGKYAHQKRHIPKLHPKLKSKAIQKFRFVETARSISKSSEKSFERLFTSSLQTSRGSIQTRDYNFDYEGDIPADIVNSDDIHSFLIVNHKTIPLQASITPK